MKKLAIRIGLVCAYLIVSVLVPFNGFVAILLWNIAAALAFVFTTIYFTGPAPIFTATIVLVVTAALPFVILCEIGMPMYHSWPASVKGVVHSLLILNPYHSLYMLAPTITTIIVGCFFGGAGPNNSVRDFPSTPRV